MAYGNQFTRITSTSQTTICSAPAIAGTVAGTLTIYNPVGNATITVTVVIYNGTNDHTIHRRSYVAGTGQRITLNQVLLPTHSIKATLSATAATAVEFSVHTGLIK